MGALHEGHVSLVRRAREWVGPEGVVMVSIFVNPIQFDRVDDLRNYPRPLEADLRICRDLGVDVAFVPEDGGMYEVDHSVVVTENSLSRGLCGGVRPGHFDGVCTVVLKLFLLTGCDGAVFGEKDFQQLAVIRRMVRDLDVPVEILACPTVREPDGLAMSSRNVRLTSDERADAPRIQRVLREMAGMEMGPVELVERVRMGIEASGMARVDYVRVIDEDTLEEVDRLDRRAVLAVAVFYGGVRLIDHVVVGGRSENLKSWDSGE
jgi:pantoate--beta-alanine ligase